MIECVAARKDYARSLDVGLTDEPAWQTTEEQCTEAQAFIDTEAPLGDNVARLIAVALARNNYDPANWNVDVTLNGEPSATDEGLMPIQAQILWRSEIDELLDQLP